MSIFAQLFRKRTHLRLSEICAPTNNLLQAVIFSAWVFNKAIRGMSCFTFILDRYFDLFFTKLDKRTSVDTYQWKKGLISMPSYNTVLYVCSWEAQKKVSESEENFVLVLVSAHKRMSSSSKPISIVSVKLDFSSIELFWFVKKCAYTKRCLTCLSVVLLTFVIVR